MVSVGMVVSDLCHQIEPTKTMLGVVYLIMPRSVFFCYFPQYGPSRLNVSLSVPDVQRLPSMEDISDPL